MAHPAASSSQPALIAVDNPHAADKAPKEKKGQGKPTNTSEFPLEVRSFLILTNLIN
jgi:hypothetical protein